MRSETEIKSLITELAFKDERIRAVLPNGSRANPNSKPDKLQDYDLVFVVRNLKTFTVDHSWTHVFGEKLIWQLLDEMALGNEDKSIGFIYLMLLKDENRIDLTLFPVENLNNDLVLDSLTIVWVDKDQLFSDIPPANDIHYHVVKPTEREFLETCNEFWWVSTYAAKGLVRDEIIYAKYMVETVVRPMFMKLIEWKVGYDTNFSVSVGKAGKFINTFLTKDFYAQVLQTYADATKEDNWQSLLIMAELFKQTADELSIKLKFAQDKVEQENVINYLRKMYSLVVPHL